MLRWTSIVLARPALLLNRAASALAPAAAALLQSSASRSSQSVHMIGRTPFIVSPVRFASAGPAAPATGGDDNFDLEDDDWLFDFLDEGFGDEFGSGDTSTFIPDFERKMMASESVSPASAAGGKGPQSPPPKK